MEGTEHVIRAKSFTYKTSTTWTEGRSGTIGSEGKPTLKISSPPEFKGERGVWTPEDLFVGSVEVCHMTTFLSFAAQKKMTIVSYRSHANGVLEHIDEDYRFTRIVIFPTITVGKDVVETDVHALLREAEKHCLVANSIASIVEVNPTIIVHPG
ncbi:MAG: OsmC family protein [Ignavibacteriae bacterium]|nr:OsmC family protein [Ignavibacteriota bacterium]